MSSERNWFQTLLFQTHAVLPPHISLPPGCCQRLIYGRTSQCQLPPGGWNRLLRSGEILVQSFVDLQASTLPDKIFSIYFVRENLLFFFCKKAILGGGGWEICFMTKTISNVSMPTVLTKIFLEHSRFLINIVWQVFVHEFQIST